MLDILPFLSFKSLCHRVRVQKIIRGIFHFRQTPCVSLALLQLFVFCLSFFFNSHQQKKISKKVCENFRSIGKSTFVEGVFWVLNRVIFLPFLRNVHILCSISLLHRYNRATSTQQCVCFCVFSMVGGAIFCFLPQC